MFQVITFEPRTLLWWYHNKGDIDFNPSYQRKSNRWNIIDQAFLIDTIINKFDIPKLYLSDFTFLNTRMNTAGKPYAVIDGKQRFEAIFKFIDGAFPLNKNIIYHKDRSYSLGGLFYKDLKQKFPEAAIQIDNYPLTVMRVITDEEEMINQLFIRLNRNQSLTGAELRNAYGGPAASAIRSLITHDFFQSKVAFKATKGQDANLAAKILYLEFKNEFTSLKKKDLDKFVRDATKYPEDHLNNTIENVFSVLSKMSSVFHTQDVLLKSEGDIPLYYLLFKNTTDPNPNKIYTGLYNFERLRKHFSTQESNEKIYTDANMRALKDLFTQYSIYRRSTNDPDSLRKRYEILNNFIRLTDQFSI